MKRKGFLQTAFTLTTALLLLAGCTQDELSDKQGEPLPEGKYPMTFTASIDGEAVAATPQTRANADDNVDISLDDLEYIGAGVTNLSMAEYALYIQRMIFKREGNIWKYNKMMTDFTQTPPPYWPSTNSNPFQVRAWYFDKGNGTNYESGIGSCYPGDYNFTWSVEKNQNANNGYKKSDFLYANDNIDFPTKSGGNKSLHFFHQTAKVVVHIIKGDQTPADITTDKISMKIGTTGSEVYVSGKWEASPFLWGGGDSKILGDWNTFNSAQGTITPKALGSKDITVNGESIKTLASYEALVIPQKIEAGKKLFVINTTDNKYAPFYYTVPTGGIKWFYPNIVEGRGGVEFTYYITIKGTSLSVTTSSSIGWDTNGASGSGSVEID